MVPYEGWNKPQRYKGDLKSFWQSIKTQKILKCYLFQLNFPYVIPFKKAALYLKNISLSGWNWRGFYHDPEPKAKMANKLDSII